MQQQPWHPFPFLPIDNVSPVKYFANATLESSSLQVSMPFLFFHELTTFVLYVCISFATPLYFMMPFSSPFL
jgi:hypothetical protein